MRFLILTVLTFTVVSVDAREWRPCGSGSDYRAHRLTPQGWKGADFRDACVKHDKYYREQDVSKAQADCEFLQDMLAQAKYSRRPRQAVIVARFMYRAVKRFGEY